MHVFENKIFKILQVTAALDQGGVERGTVEMAAFIVAQGAESWVASRGGRLVRKLEEQGSRHVCLPLAQRNPLTVLYSAMKLRRLILKEQISLVHARSRSPAWAAYWACRWTNTPFITTFHGTHRIQNRVKKYYNSIMVRGQRVIAISQFIKRHIIENYDVDERQIGVAPRGYDPDIFNPALFSEHDRLELKKSLGIDADCPIISIPGRLTRWKGQTIFLEALAKITDLSWQALLIGGASKKTAYENELKKLTTALGIGDRVSFLGSQSDIVPYYAISDLVVSASTEPEAFGRVAVEAQAMSKPVIASAHGGALETVQDGVTGWLFENGVASSLADKLRMALSDLERLKVVGDNAVHFVGKSFTVEQMCRKEWSTYMEVSILCQKEGK